MKKPHMDEYVNGIHLWWGRLYNAFLVGGIPVETHTCEVQETTLQEGQLHRTELTREGDLSTPAWGTRT